MSRLTMLVATTLMGYRYRSSQTWQNSAGAVAGVLRQVRVGGYGQPSNGMHSVSGEIVCERCHEPPGMERANYKGRTTKPQRAQSCTKNCMVQDSLRAALCA